MIIAEKDLKVGDKIVVTRTSRAYGTTTIEGVVRDLNTLGGFRIEGYDAAGWANRWLASADRIIPFGITQTITHA